MCVRTRISFLWLLLLPLPGWALEDPASEPIVTPATEQQITQLINELGADKYRTRERAENQLRMIGLLAMEALRDVEDHEDIEIRLRARRLVGELRGRFISEGVPPSLMQLMSDYDKQPYEARQSTILSLGGMIAQFNADLVDLEDTSGDAALTVLTRLARFEESEILAKEAAILVLGCDLKQHDGFEERQRTILQAIGFSRRVPVQWLRSYVLSYSEPSVAISEFDTWVQSEAELVASAAPDTNRDILNRLTRIDADILLRTGHKDKAYDVMRQLELGPKPEEALYSIDWLVDREAWPIVIELSKKEANRFDQDALLTYRVAEVLELSGQTEEAKKTARRAFSLAGMGIVDYVKPYELAGPLSRFARAIDPLTSRHLSQQPGDDAARRLVIASVLEDGLGLCDWAEREYRQVARLPLDGSNYFGLQSRLRLAEMFHDQLQEQAAGDELQELVTLLEALPPKEAEGALDMLGRELKDLRGSMHYYHACQARLDQDYEKQREFLDKAIAEDPDNVDVLIGMYHVPSAPSEWKQQAHEKVKTKAAELFAEIVRLRSESNPFEPNRALPGSDNDFTLAFRENQFAWLVGNTEGDVEEAIRCSRHSLTVQRAVPTYLDTLGRCYYRHGDFRNAVKFQRLAVLGMPHEGQIQRQLELFEQALAEEEAGPDRDDSLDVADPAATATAPATDEDSSD